MKQLTYIYEFILLSSPYMTNEKFLSLQFGSILLWQHHIFGIAVIKIFKKFRIIKCNKYKYIHGRLFR